MAAVRTACACVLAAAFFVPLALGAVVDLRERRVPNACTAALALGGLLRLGLGALDPGGAPFGWLPGWGECLGCCAVCLAGGGAGEWLWRTAHRGAHGLGLGDVKLLGALALWIGAGVFGALGLACGAALAVELPRGRRTFAFGPYLAAASVVCLVAGALW